ncbi:MAG: hypothetical protein WCK03_04930 [Candidatus Taylorbacteria bacterium]
MPTKIAGTLDYFIDQGMEGNAALLIYPHKGKVAPKSWDMGKLKHVTDYEYIKIFNKKDVVIYCGPVFFGRVLLRSNYKGYLFNKDGKYSDAALHSMKDNGKLCERLPNDINWTTPMIGVEEWLEFFESGIRAICWTGKAPTKMFYNYGGTELMMCQDFLGVSSE